MQMDNLDVSIRNLLKMGVEDEEPEPVNYFQLFCIHLALTNPDVVLQQSRQIAMKLKEHIFPGSSELEDLCWKKKVTSGSGLSTYIVFNLVQVNAIFKLMLISIYTYAFIH